MKRILLPLVTFLAAGLLWEALSLSGLWSSSLFPGPEAVGLAIAQLLADGTLLRHAVASVYRVTVGYYLALLLGVPLGMVLGWWRVGQLSFNSLIQFLRPISPLAWIPLALLWFGIGDRPAIFLIFLASFFPLVVAAMSAVHEIDQTYFRVAANFAFTRSETLSMVILPAVLPQLLPAARISLGVAWLVVVAAEMIAVKSGLGYLILDSRNALRMDYVMGAMITIGIIGVGLDLVMSQLRRLEPSCRGRSG